VLTLAVLFAIPVALYSGLWMYSVRHGGAPVELGFSTFPLIGANMQVQTVVKGSPAEQAGLRVDDRIMAINGRPMVNMDPFNDVWYHARPGDGVDLTVQRPGMAATIPMHAVFRASTDSGLSDDVSLAKRSALEITGSYPVLFLVIGLAVLFLRPDDTNAWLLALLFAAIIAVPDNPPALRFPFALRVFYIGYRGIFVSMLSGLFYLFFAVFPARSPMDRRLPWLKWVGLAMGAFFAFDGVTAGHPRLPVALANTVSARAQDLIPNVCIYTFLLFGFLSLVSTAFRSGSADACRKGRVILWGTVVGLLPAVLERAAIDFVNYQPPFWINVTIVVIVFLFPLSFAYAVVKHRVLEIPVLLKRSARYVLVQRGFFVLIFLLAAVAITVFTRMFSRLVPQGPNLAMGLSAVFGIVLVWVSAPMVRRGTERIDRAFFRSAYDARLILENLAVKIRTATSRERLAALLSAEISAALHPAAIAIYFEGHDARRGLERIGDGASGGSAIPPQAPLLAELARRGSPWDVPPESGAAGNGHAESEAGGTAALFAPLLPECLVPVIARDARLSGLIALGRRLSDEPYSGEDKRLLASVAGQAGLALESIHMAEEMAERMEVERRSARELEIAREVQSRLLPQQAPELRTLDCAGLCIQARSVGGDYYDFLELPGGRVALVLADVAGKGISSALLMSNIQAHLRSLCADGVENLPRQLAKMNRLLWKATSDQDYATVFFAIYDDASRRLEYVSCGHNPVLLLRANGTAEMLQSTATVLGMFEKWECTLAETALGAGDILVIYSDGVTEAANAAGVEFGVTRLADVVRGLRPLPAADLVRRISETVLTFSEGAQADDLTLVVACGLR
jgi:sigma-B regulation protein RsbU (phosphoserine phosphatase)